MPEAIEVPVEAAQEHIHHGAHTGPSWNSYVALSSAIFAVLAAVAALSAGGHSNEAVLEQIDAANMWAYYQSKGIKSDILASKLEMMASMDKPATAKDLERKAKLDKDKEEAMANAHELEEKSKQHLRTHELLARAVTFFQITIAVGAISVLTRRRRFFFVSLGFGAVGLVFFALGFLLHFR